MNVCSDVFIFLQNKYFAIYYSFFTILGDERDIMKNEAVYAESTERIIIFLKKCFCDLNITPYFEIMTDGKAKKTRRNLLIYDYY